MDERKPNRKRPGGKKPAGGAAKRHPKPFQQASSLRVQKLEGKHYALQPPRCALERDLDLEDVAALRAEGEPEAARDELLHLVEDCRGFLEAYNLLAELALEEGDIPLARGYYGFGYESGLDALGPGFRGPLPADAGYNAHFFLAGRGLARCLISLKSKKEAREVLEQLRRFDPNEPDVKALLDELAGPAKGYT